MLIKTVFSLSRGESHFEPAFFYNILQKSGVKYKAQKKVVDILINDLFISYVT
jgi:hypothetical protein